MLNEIEKQNVSAAIFKFLLWGAILVAVGFWLVDLSHHLTAELNSISERLVHLL